MIGENCYLVQEDFKTFTEAEANCKSLGAILAEPRSSEEQDLVGEFCTQKIDNCFIGLKGDGTGRYVWRRIYF